MSDISYACEIKVNATNWVSLSAAGVPPQGSRGSTFSGYDLAEARRRAHESVDSCFDDLARMMQETCIQNGRPDNG